MSEQQWKVCGQLMKRRPVSTAPSSIPLCYVDRDGGALKVARRRDGNWDDGRGRAFKQGPTHWTIWESGDPLAEGRGHG